MLAGNDGTTLHLIQRFDDGAAGFEIWVEATSFEVVRLAATKPRRGWAPARVESAGLLMHRLLMHRVD